MNQPQISHGWLLLALVVLISLVGALEQPIAEDEPQDAAPDTAPPAFFVRLQCERENVAESAVPQRDTRPQVGLVSYGAARAAWRAQASQNTGPVLRCFVIDE